MSDDPELERVFRLLRSVERLRVPVPAFGQVRSRKLRKGPVGVPALGWLALGSAAALLLWLGLSAWSRAGELAMARQVLAWRSPTEFLLPDTVPEVLRGVPDLERAVAGSPLAALDPGGELGPPDTSRSPR